MVSLLLNKKDKQKEINILYSYHLSIFIVSLKYYFVNTIFCIIKNEVENEKNSNYKSNYKG